MRAIALSLSLLASPALGQSCGGDFGTFLDGVRAEATARGIDAEAVSRFLS